ncbi:heavy metal-binding domain-containing protein [Kaistella sp. 97-N-M2]
MHPQIVGDKPGKCPICHMDLVPVEKKKMPIPMSLS